MKLWKHLLLIAGVAGVIGLFLPLVEVRHGPIVVGFTAKQLSFGMDGAHTILDTRLPRFAERRLPRDVRAMREDARLVADASRGAALAFAPAALLGLLGALGFLLRRCGRVFGAFALLLGLASLGAWVGLRYVLAYALEEAAFEHTTVALQLGAHSLLVIGGLGVLGGIGALARPETRT